MNVWIDVHVYLIDCSICGIPLSQVPLRVIFMLSTGTVTVTSVGDTVVSMDGSIVFYSIIKELGKG